MHLAHWACLQHHEHPCWQYRLHHSAFHHVTCALLQSLQGNMLALMAHGVPNQQYHINQGCRVAAIGTLPQATLMSAFTFVLLCCRWPRWQRASCSGLRRLTGLVGRLRTMTAQKTSRLWTSARSAITSTSSVHMRTLYYTFCGGMALAWLYDNIKSRIVILGCSHTQLGARHLVF